MNNAKKRKFANLNKLVNQLKEAGINASRDQVDRLRVLTIKLRREWYNQLNILDYEDKGLEDLYRKKMASIVYRELKAHGYINRVPWEGTLYISSQPVNVVNCSSPPAVFIE